MKKILAIGILILFYACTEEEVIPLPNARFQIRETTGGPKRANELKVTFDNYSDDATSYLWDFGDGNTSTETEPTHYYQNNGNYTITLTAYNENGEPSSTSKEYQRNFGEVVFYITTSNYGSVSIYPSTSIINWQSWSGTITTWHPYSPPSCWENNTFTYTSKAGTYTYYAESCSGGSFTSQYQVIADQCTKVKIF